MNTIPGNINDIAGAIQLALAPAFLLTAIAGILNVMASRLSRIIDRGRVLTEEKTREESSPLAALRQELDCLEHRRRYTSIAITACTIAALLLCLVIGTLFIEVMLGIPLKWFISTLFTAATLALVTGLAYFLREVHLAMQTIRIPTSSGE